MRLSLGFWDGKIIKGCTNGYEIQLQEFLQVSSRGESWQTEEEKAMWPQNQKLKWWGLKPRHASRHQELDEARNKFSNRASEGTMAFLTP